MWICAKVVDEGGVTKWQVHIVFLICHKIWAFLMYFSFFCMILKLCWNYPSDSILINIFYKKNTTLYACLGTQKKISFTCVFSFL